MPKVKNSNYEKGSIAVYAIATTLCFLIILGGIFAFSSGIRKNELNTLIKIKEIYAQGVGVANSDEETTIDLSLQSTTIGTSITATVTHSAGQGGVAITKCKYICNTTSGNLGTTNTLWNTANSFRSNPQTITLTVDTVGAYYLHVLTVDNAGNKTEKTSSSITFEMPSGWDSNKVVAVKSNDNVIVPVPKGFTASTISSERNVSTGFVIKQGSNGAATSGINEFVWVPVDDPSTMFGTDKNGNSLGKLYEFSGTSASPLNWTETNGIMSWTSATSNREPDIVKTFDGSDATKDASYFKSEIGNMTGAQFKNQLQQEFENMRDSVEIYGGFYIGRYETGNLSKTKAVVQKNNTDINNQNWYVMYNRCKTIAQGTSGTSSMLWGCQWDATLRWFLESENKEVVGYVTEAINKGNFGTGALIATGSVSKYSVNNIYDMAGNMIDWTIEADLEDRRVNRRRRL